MPFKFKLKSTEISITCMYVWRYHTISPNVNAPILFMSFGAKLPNLMTANIYGYTV